MSWLAQYKSVELAGPRGDKGIGEERLQDPLSVFIYPYERF